MRAIRRIIFLPLAILALSLQVWAPAVATAATARMADPFADLPICSTSLDGQADPAGKAPSGKAGHDCQLCTVCQPAAVDAPPLAPTPASPPGAQRIAVWTVIESSRPRAPPQRTARARAPPSIA